MASDSYLASFLVVVGLGALFLALLYCLVQLSKTWKLALIDRVLRALKRRRNSKDTFRQDYGYSWDYFMVFKVYDEDDVVSDFQRDYSFQYILDRLTAGGLEVRLFYSLQRKEVFCKIRCPLHRLQKHADLTDFKLLLDREALKTICSTGREGLWDPIKLQEFAEHNELTTLSAFEYIYAKYEFDTELDLTNDHLFPLYKKWPRLTIEHLMEERNEVATSMFGNVKSTNDDISTNNLLRVPSARNAATSPSTRNPMGGGALSPNKGGEGMTADEDGGHRERILEESTLFRGADRMKLIHAIIQYHGPGGCALDPYQLIKDKCILAYGPLHDMVELRELEGEWLTLIASPWEQPFDKIKNYFGEKIGLYFLWLGVYTSWLVPAAIVGFGVWIHVATEGNNANAASIPYFCGFMGLWSALFLENWKRTEKTTSMKWGMIGFEEEEQPRPQFKGEKVQSPVTGKPDLYFNPAERAARVQFSQSVICTLVLLVIAIIAAIFGLRVVMANANFEIAGVQMASIIASILISIQIQVFNGIFGEIALKLNNQENHRTDTEYEDALIGKVFLFQFVNSFASLFYITFIKPFIPGIDPCTVSCMLELQTTLATIFLTRLALGNLTELGIPMVKTVLENRKRKQAMLKTAFQHQSVASPSPPPLAVNSNSSPRTLTRSAEGLELSSNMNDPMMDTSLLNDLPSPDDGKFELSEIEKTFLMEEYHVMLGTFDDYAEMVIQFGYTTMFVAGFPLATVMSLVNNYVEIRIDAYKLCHVCRRPEPRSQEDIGTWQGIMEVISYSSIFVNSAIVAYTTTIAIDYTWVERAWIFILMASGLFGIRLIVEYLIPDVPVEVEIQLARQEYLVRKVAFNVEDEDDSDLGKNNFITPNYLVLQTDDDPL